MRRLSLNILLILVGGWVSAQQTFTLEEAKSFALDNSPLLKYADMDIANSESTIKETRAIGLPKLKAGVDYLFYAQKPKTPFSFGVQQAPTVVLDEAGDRRLVNYVVTSDPELTQPVAAEEQLISFVQRNSLAANVELSTLLFDMSYVHALRASRVFRDYYQANKSKTEQDLKADVESAFIDVLFVVENKEVIEANIKNIKQTLFTAEESYKEGFIEKLDVDRLRLSLKRLNNEKQNLNRNIQQAKLFLKYQMGFPLENEISLTGNLVEVAEGTIVNKVDEEMDFSTRVENEIFSVSNQLNLLNIKNVEASYYPSLIGFVQHQQQLQREKIFRNDEAGFVPATILGLSLNATIFDGWNRDAKMEKAIIMKERTLVQESEFKRGVKLQFETAKSSLIGAIESAILEKEALDMSSNIFEITTIKYKEGVGSSLEVQQAERDLYSSQASYLQKLYEVVKGEFEIRKTQGKI